MSALARRVRARGHGAPALAARALACWSRRVRGRRLRGLRHRRQPERGDVVPRRCREAGAMRDLANAEAQVAQKARRSRARPASPASMPRWPSRCAISPPIARRSARTCARWPCASRSPSKRRRPAASTSPAARAARAASLTMAITLQDALQRTIEHREIFHDEMLSVMRRIMSGEVSPVMIAALTVGLRVKKETIGEIAAAAQVMREFATPVEVADRRHLLDIVGTGGDAPHTFNISTASMFVAAAAGARVAKHGNRSVSSQLGQRRRARGARRQHHADARSRSPPASRSPASGSCSRPIITRAMKHAGPVRRELGVRTIFNILGPLTNPAGAPNQLVGVFHPGPRGHPRARAAAPRRRARARRLRQGRHGRGVARRGDHGRRAARTARCASTRSIPRTSACT